jgi:hypothetical protein
VAASTSIEMHLISGAAQRNTVGNITAQSLRPIAVVPGSADARVAQARAELAVRLDAIAFAQDNNQQEHLERRYLDWAANVHAARQEVFGGDYVLGEDMKTQWLQRSLPSAVFEAGRGMLSSMSRSPVRNALVARLSPRSGTPRQPGELATGVDALLAGGAGGGVGSFLSEKTLLAAMDDQARRRNLPEMKLVKPTVLAPNPSPVQLVVQADAQGTLVKQYYQPATADALPEGHEGLAAVPTRPSLLDQAGRARWQIGFAQGLSAEKHIGALVQPLLTGTSNTIRRGLSTAEQLLAPSTVLGSSMLASGLAGFITKLVLHAARGTPYLDQVEVDGLLGRPVRLNRHVPQGRGKGADMASWQDIGQLPDAAWETLRDTLTLLSQVLLHPSWGSAGDLGFRNMLPNMGASVAAPGYAVLLAQILRGGSTNSQPGEGPQSPANLLQQFTQSAINDLVWPALREVMSYMKAEDAKAALERRHTGDLAQLQNDKAGVLLQLAHALEALRRLLPRPAQRRQPAFANWVSRVEALAKAPVQALNADDLRVMRNDLDLDPPEAAGLTQAVVQSIDQLLELLAKVEHIDTEINPQQQISAE